MNHVKWNFDGQETIASEGAVVKWDNDTFFTITYNWNSFFGEVLEENTENNLLRIKSTTASLLSAKKDR